MKSRNFTKSPREVVVVAHNIRSILNVGAILRSAEGFGVAKVFASGYTPNLDFATDGSSAKLLPHVREKLSRELHKSALGAEEIIGFSFAPNVLDLIQKLRDENFLIAGLEQDERAINIGEFNAKFPPERFAKVALILGEEVNGLTQDLREICDVLAEIPMFGRKESFNVSVASGIALYEITASCSVKTF